MKRDHFIGEKSKVSILEISLCFVLFFFLLIRGTFRGALLPILLFTLPYVMLYVYALFNRNIKRGTFNKLIFVAFCIFYIGMKFYRGMDCLNMGSDRDDALYQSVTHFLNGEYPYDKLTFLHHVIFTGPSSILLSLPFVKFFNSIQIFSTATILFLVIYLWQYAEKDSRVPILSLSLTIMTLTPFFNTIFWGAEEELLYGLPFLYLAVITFFSKNIKSDSIKGIVIGMLLGISVMVRMTYMFPALGVLFLILRHKRVGNFTVTLLSFILTALLICLPFVNMNMGHFIAKFPPIWFIGGISFISQITLFFLAFVIQMYFYTIRKMNLRSQFHILISLGIFIGYIPTGYFSMPWHVLYWAVPFMITFPYLYGESWPNSGKF